jgi:hypothetical protein
MNRRAFLSTLAGSLLAAPLAAEAQPAGKRPRMGYLSSGRRPTAPDDVSAESIRVIRESLGAFGYVEGQNLGIEYRFAEDRSERLPALAADLVALQVDLILAIGPASIRAAKGATSTIPIAALDFESDPVGAGFAASLARPAGNITGIFLDQAELVGKWLELIKEAVPGLSRVAGPSGGCGPGASAESDRDRRTGAGTQAPGARGAGAARIRRRLRGRDAGPRSGGRDPVIAYHRSKRRAAVEPCDREASTYHLPLSGKRDGGLSHGV